MLVYYDNVTGAIEYTLKLSLHCPPPPGDYIEVDDIELDPLQFHVVDGFLELREVPTDAQRAAAQETIQRLRGDLRARHITVLPGQDMVYLVKRAEAIDFLAHPDPTPALFPDVYNEVGVTAATAYEVVQVWLNMNDMWRQISRVIEKATLKASDLVGAATSTAQIDAAIAQMQADLVALIPG